MDARVRGHDGIFVIPAEAGIHKPGKLYPCAV